MKILMILNEPPYGNERSYNALRLAGSLVKTGKAEVKVFLIGDAPACAHGGQKVPHGYYNVETMIGAIVRNGAEIGVCGSCMDARGVTEEGLAKGCRRRSMEELSAWTLDSDRVLVF